jgi:carboxyl-terminal processing protease
MKVVSKSVLAVSAAIVLLFLTAFSQSDLFFRIKKQLTIYGDVFKTVATRYVDEVEPETLTRLGLQGMLGGLDPYTVFIDEGELQQLEILSSGVYGGIGIEAGFRGERVVIIAPLEGYPAERAGLRPGDIIEAVNGSPVTGFTPDEVQSLTIGDPGTTIEMTVRRPAIDQQITVTMERERIEVRNISYAGFTDENSQIGYIKISRFGQRTAEELRANLIELNDESDMKGLILDLRNNPGGLLNEAVDVVDKFIEPGVTVVETRGRFESQSVIFTSQEPALYESLPIVVLINNGSASASEVVAGALQDLDRAVILGENSFGKGLVQEVRPLSYNTSIKITISEYYTPSGRGIQAVDYSDEDQGSFGSEIPDSLRREFLTKNGRTVYDGMGIEPDIALDSSANELLYTALQSENLFFFFVSEYLSGEGPVVQVPYPDDLYNQFSRYLQQQGFTFTTSADQYLESLESSIDQFSSQSDARENLEELRALLRDQKISMIYDNRDLIERELRTEWISQTLSGEERLTELLKIDTQVRDAIRILENPADYRSILIP